MWIELHESARQHPKVLGLSRDMGETWPTALGWVCALWTWTLTMAPDGDLSSFEPEDVEFGCGWTGEPGVLFAALVKRRLIDIEQDSVIVHDWWDFAGSMKAAEKKRDQRKRSKKPTTKRPPKDGPGTVPGRSRRPTDRPTGTKDQNERPDQFQTTFPPNPPDPEDTKHPELPDAEQQFLEIREYADAIWKRETRGLPRHDETFWRVLEALKEYGLDGCRQIVRGHHQQTEKKQFSGIRFAFPAVKGHPAQLDMDWIATYHGAGRKDAKPPQAPNMQSPEPSELAAQMEAEAIAEHEKYCNENGVDPKDAGAIRKLARAAEKTRRSGSGPSKAFK